MIECSKCGAKYPTERLFCGKCKERLGIRCPTCGRINFLDDLFCGICLTELNAQTATLLRKKPEKPVLPERSLYEEIRMEAEEDEAFDFLDEKISQEEIDEIFQMEENDIPGIGEDEEL